MNITQSSCLIIADHTVDTLSEFLHNDGETPVVEASVAPFDQVIRVMLDRDMECWKQEPDFVVVWTRPEAAVPAFNSFCEYLPSSPDQVDLEVDRFAELIRGVANRVEAVFVPTWTTPYYLRGMGLLNMRSDVGISYTLMRMNIRLADALTDISNVYLLDASRWMSIAGINSTNAKSWFLGKVAYGREVFKQASADIKSGLQGIAGQSRKLVIVDLDDTLWGGIVGDVGWEQLQIGGHDPIGEAFRDFQQSLKALSNRGILLGIVSKNEESVALRAIEQHPEMVLRLEDFAGWKISWKDKAEAIVDLVSDLNLGLESAVFIDDNPFERSRVREALPQVFVPDWVADKTQYKRALLELRCFDTRAITSEDIVRTKSYVSERKRNTVKESLKSVEEWLASLGSIVRVETLDESNIARATQLLNKTNQMNLTTRRLSESEFLEFAGDGDQAVFVFRVSDRFGDYGLTGIASLSMNGSVAEIRDFVLSCRVMGRSVEQSILHTLVDYCRAIGVREVMATCIPTEKNMPCQQFFSVESGFEPRGEAGSYFWQSSDKEYQAPPHITIEAVGGAGAHE